MKKNTTGDRERLPVDPLTGEQLQPRIQSSYYPGYSTLSQQAFWDAATRAVTLEQCSA